MLFFFSNCTSTGTVPRKMKKKQPEDHWSSIPHLSAEDMLKLVVFEEKKFKHSPGHGQTTH